jgi:hypothetical protein
MGPIGPTGATGPTGPAGQGVVTLNSLNGIPCGGDNSGTTRLVYGSGGAVSIFCDMEPPSTDQPNYIALAVAGNGATVTFDRPVCRVRAWAIADWQVTVNGVATQYEDIGDTIPLCKATGGNEVTQADLMLQQAVPDGAFVAVTLSATGGADIRDANDHGTAAPRTNTATASGPDVTSPQLLAAFGRAGETWVRFVFTEAVWCGPTFNTTDIAFTGGLETVAFGADGCATVAASADSSFEVSVSSPLVEGAAYRVTFGVSANEIQDVAGNDLQTPAEAMVQVAPADLIPPTLVDAQITANVISTDLGDVGDAFMLGFSEPMDQGDAFGAQIFLIDADGTQLSVSCDVTASCTWNLDGTVLTMTWTATPETIGGSIPGLQTPANFIGLSMMRDVAGNMVDLSVGGDFVVDLETSSGSPTITDARVTNNVATTDLLEPGDEFRLSFSDTMNLNPAGTLLIQDQDGTLATLLCGTVADCAWNGSINVMTVRLTATLEPTGGTTPSLQIPASVVSMRGIWVGLTGTVPYLAGSDALIDFE